MIIKLFKQGTGDGASPIKYLFDEQKHAGYTPILVKGDPKITKSAIDAISRRHKYSSGVISFAPGEVIDSNKQYDLILEFERVFAPFADESRINFLWVRHEDKGRLELHFISPRVDLKTGKAYNLHPPGRANELFFRSFVACKNYEFGFQQVDKKFISSENYEKKLNIVDQLCKERVRYISERFDNLQKINTLRTKGLKNGRSRRNKSLPSAISKFDSEFRNSVNRSQFAFSFNGTTIGSYGTNSTRRTGNDLEFAKADKSVDFGDNWRDSIERRSVSSSENRGITQEVLHLGSSLENQIYALSIELLSAPRNKRMAIEIRLAQLQAELIKQGYVEMNKKIQNLNAPKLK